MPSDKKGKIGSVVTPKNEKIKIAKKITQFSKTTKEKIVTEIKEKLHTEEQRKDILRNAAINMCEFSGVLGQKLFSLQQAYKAHESNDQVIGYLQQAIIGYVDTEGFKLFDELLAAEFTEDNWKTGTLSYVAELLDIEIEEEPSVEAIVENGKIYWRIVKGDQELYNRPTVKEIDFNFGKTNTWRMSWKQFRAFKDSGKRGGTVYINEKRFRAHFKEKYRAQASAVWKELKSKGILNAKDRLSDNWRVLSGFDIRLVSIEPGEEVISNEMIQECLGKIRQIETNTIVREEFVKWWDKKFQLRAESIWDILKDRGILDKDNKIDTLDFSIKDFLKDIHLNYKDVVEAIYGILNNEKKYTEKVSGLAEFTIYRAERSLKKWHQTGNITNEGPRSDKYCTKRWDVSVYNDLKQHRNTENERKTCEGSKLEYDHIPSRAILQARVDSIKDRIMKKITKLNKEIKDTDENIKMKKRKLRKIKSKINVGQQKQLSKIRGQIRQEKLWRNFIEYEKIFRNSELSLIKSEIDKKGDKWWAIAIPEKLHSQGDTYFKSLMEQQKNKEHPFFSNIQTYVNILEKNAKDFSLSIDNVIEMLGALRYMYHCQVKRPTIISSQYKIGNVPRTFFRNIMDNKKIDKLFNESVRRVIEKKEGIIPVAEAPNNSKKYTVV